MVRWQNTTGAKNSYPEVTNAVSVAVQDGNVVLLLGDGRVMTHREDTETRTRHRATRASVSCERIADTTLERAVRSAEDGLIDTDLGGGLIKQRLSRPGQGKSSGYRTVIAYRCGDRAVDLFGFAKNQRANLDDNELAVWLRVGQGYLGLDDAELEAAITAGDLTEASNDN